MSKVRRFRVTIDGEVFIVELEEEELEKALSSLSTSRVTKEPKVSSASLQPRAQPTALLQPVKRAPGLLVAPMSGKIISIKKAVGDKVEKGEVVAVMESMKTIIEIKSDVSGVVEEVYVKEGTFVQANQRIARIKKE